jgi:hypothetical protein
MDEKSPRIRSTENPIKKTDEGDRDEICDSLEQDIVHRQKAIQRIRKLKDEHKKIESAD